MFSKLSSRLVTLLASLRASFSRPGPLAALPFALALPFGFALLAPAARASDITLPAGFNIETSPASAGNLAAVLPDGTQLVSTGSFGADELSVRHADGRLTLFAVGFGSIAGIAQSPVTGDIIVGDSFFLPVLHVLHDLNNDGDALDAGENVPSPVSLPVLSNRAAPLPFALTFRPGTDELFITGSTPFGVSPTLGVVVRVSGGVSSVFAEGFGYVSGQIWVGDKLYVADLDALSFVGRVLALKDGNADGDALDAGEAVAFASNLSGASDLVHAQDGSFYLSGLFDFSDFSSTVGRLLPDLDNDGLSDGVDELFIDGFSFTGGLALLEGAGGFVPGAGGDGLLVVQDFGAQTLDRVVRTAPLATLALSGAAANNSAFTMTVGGAPGAAAMVLLSTDQLGPTLHGIGDLCAGFNSPYLLLPMPRVSGAGSTSRTLLFHAVDGAVGIAFTVQAFTLEAGDIGISNAFDLVLAP